MDDPRRIHADPAALERLRELQREGPPGEAPAHDRLATAFAALLDALGKGEADAVRAALHEEGWGDARDVGALDAERLEFTRGLAHEAARALERPEPWVMAAGIALRQAMGLWIRAGKGSADYPV